MMLWEVVAHLGDVGCMKNTNWGSNQRTTREDEWAVRRVVAGGLHPYPNEVGNDS